MSNVEENRQAMQSTILDCDKDLERFKEQKSELAEEIEDHVGGYQESRDITKLQEEVDALRKRLNAKLSQDPDFITLQEQKAALNLEIKDTKEILSTHVVAWKINTHEDQIEVGDNLGKQIVVSGKLGKVGSYQTNMFSSSKSKKRFSDAEVTISASGPDGQIGPEVKTTVGELGDVAKKLKKK